MKKYNATSGIQLEPHSEFKTAIIGLNARGEYVYSYDRLVDVCLTHYKMGIEDAREWVDYNIIGLEPNGFEVRL